MVSYLIFRIIFLGMLVIGIAYSILSDIVDNFIPLYSTSPLSVYNIPENQWGFDVVVLLFKFGSIILALIGLIYYSLTMAQKPEQPWGR